MPYATVSQTWKMYAARASKSSTSIQSNSEAPPILTSHLRNHSGTLGGKHSDALSAVLLETLLGKRCKALRALEEPLGVPSEDLRGT